jgi:hypothetical protein
MNYFRSLDRYQDLGFSGRRIARSKCLPEPESFFARDRDSPNEARQIRLQQRLFLPTRIAMLYLFEPDCIDFGNWGSERKKHRILKELRRHAGQEVNPGARKIA